MPLEMRLVNHPKRRSPRAYMHIGLVMTLLLNSVLHYFLALFAVLDARRDST